MDPPSGIPPPPPPPGPPPRSISSASGHRRRASSPITALLTERSPSSYASTTPSQSRQSHLSGRPPSPSMRSSNGMSIDAGSSNLRQTAASRIVEERRRAAQAMLESTELVEDVLGKEDAMLRHATYLQASSQPAQQGDRENKPPNAYTDWDVSADHDSKSSDGITTSTRSTAHHHQQSQSRGGRSRERLRYEPSPGRSGSAEPKGKRPSATNTERRLTAEPPAAATPAAMQKKGKQEEVEKKKGGGLFGIFGRGRDKAGAHRDSKVKPTKGPSSNQQNFSRNPSPPVKPQPQVKPQPKAHPTANVEASRPQVPPQTQPVVSTSSKRSKAPEATAASSQRSPAVKSPSTARNQLMTPPKNIKPGQSYKSSPNSAEIVVRTSLIQTPSRPEPPVSGRQIRSPGNTWSSREKQTRTPTLFSFSGRQDPDGCKDPPIGQSFSNAEDPPESPSTLGVALSTSMDSYAHAPLEAPPSFSMDFVPHKKGRDPSLASMGDDRTAHDSESGLVVASTTSASLDESTGDVLVHKLGRLVSDTTFSGSQQSSHGQSSRSRLRADYSVPSPVASLPSRGDMTDLAEEPMPEPVESMELEDEDEFMELPAPPSNIGTMSFDSHLQASHVSRRDELSALRAVSMLDPSDSTTTSSSTMSRSTPVQAMSVKQSKQSSPKSSRLTSDTFDRPLETLHRPAQTIDYDPTMQAMRVVATAPEASKQMPPSSQEKKPRTPSESQFQSEAAASSKPTPVAVHLQGFAEIVVSPDEVSAITDPSYRKRDPHSAILDERSGVAVDNEEAETLDRTKEPDVMSARSDDPVVAQSEESDPYKQIFDSDSPSSKSIDPFTDPFFKGPRPSTPPQTEAKVSAQSEVVGDEDELVQSLEIALTRTDTDRGSTLNGAVDRAYHIESGYISAASTEDEEKKVDDEMLAALKKKIMGWESQSSANEQFHTHSMSGNQGRPPLIETSLSYSSAGVSSNGHPSAPRPPVIETALSYSSAGVSTIEQMAVDRAPLLETALSYSSAGVQSTEHFMVEVDKPTASTSSTPRSMTTALHQDTSQHAESVQPSPTAATVVDHREAFSARDRANRLSSLQVGTSPGLLNSRPVPPSPETPESSGRKSRKFTSGLEASSKKEDANPEVAKEHSASLYSRATQKLTSQALSPRQRRRVKAAASPKNPLDSDSLRPAGFPEECIIPDQGESAKHTTNSFSPKQQAMKKVMDPTLKKRPMFASKQSNASLSSLPEPGREIESTKESHQVSSTVPVEEPAANSTTTTSYLAKLRGGRKARQALRARPDKLLAPALGQAALSKGGQGPGKNRLGLLEEVKKNPASVRSKKGQKGKSKVLLEKTTQLPSVADNRKRAVVIDAVAKGFSIKSMKRKTAIAQGKAMPVVLKPKPKHERTDSHTTSSSGIEKLIKDPIQRAGFRLLSKAAIPIQSMVRRYLAQREAVDRMWALIEIQSYFRRWKCEAFKLAHTYSATRIQAAFRGWRDRDTLEDRHFCATQIQKVIRGYLVFSFVHEILKRIPLVQAQVRGFIARRVAGDRMYAIILIQAVVRSHLSRVYVVKMRAATEIQRIARGMLARGEAVQRRTSATVIQAAWRSFSTRLTFQLDFVDIITVQSVVRRWLACKRINDLNREQRNSAAVKIQAAWRGYHDYTLYIFAMADVIVVQRALRMWQAKMKVNAMREQKETANVNARRCRCATVIQSSWRRFSAQADFVSQLVNIILIQSMARRYLARKMRNHVSDWKDARVRAACLVQKWRRMVLFRRRMKIHRAATKLQTLWRGFWQYTHYIIVQYEIVRVQALVRGNLARNYFGMRLGCAIIIQATGRQFLARKRVRSTRTANVLIHGASRAMRESIACRKIQSLWRKRRRSRIEKAAGLVIERFFLMVKEEVDREIRRREKKRTSKSKREKRRRHKKEPEDKILERAWLNTVDENKVDEFAYPMNSDSKSIGTESRSKSAPRLRNTFSTESGLSFHQSVVSTGKASTTVSQKKHVTLRDQADILHNERSWEDSDVSGLTNPTYRFSYRSRQSALTQKELSDDLSLEEAFLDVQAHHTKQKRKTVDDYIQKYGLQKSMTIKSQASAHTRVSIESRVTSMSRASAASRRFFPEEIETPRSTYPGAGSPVQSTRPHTSAHAVTSALSKTRILPVARALVGAEKGNDKYASSPLFPSSSSVSSSEAGFNAYGSEQVKAPAALEAMSQTGGPFFARSAQGRPSLELYASSSSPRDDSSFYRVESA